MTSQDIKATAENASSASHAAPAEAAPVITGKAGSTAKVRAIRALAFYLPQFHPIPENDAWWGTGFTEWTHVGGARRLYRGHSQPHIPADLGFYDLRLTESREAQATLAQAYGVEGFCYWHYWFAARRILQRPFDEMLTSGKPNFPFCLAWANQTWSGVWYGAPDRILIEQTYPGAEDDKRHFDHLLPAFRDSRYIHVDGRPLFYIFRPELLPDAAAFVERWRSMAKKAGLPGLYLIAEVSDLLGRGPRYTAYARDGFDAGVYVRLPARLDRRTVATMRLRRKLLRQPERYPYAASFNFPCDQGDARLHPCVYPNWDNTPRSGRGGLVIDRSSPEAFRIQVHSAVAVVRQRPRDHRLLFVKSWNEWAEGNYLEPDTEQGRGFLEVIEQETR